MHESCSVIFPLKQPDALVSQISVFSNLFSKVTLFRGAAYHRGSILASHPAAPGLIPSIPENFFIGTIIDVAYVNQRPWLEESVDQNHLVLASGQPVLQKK